MENVIFSLSTTLIGMLVVFAGLVILIVCLTCMNKLMNAKKENAGEEAAQNAAPAAPAPAPAEEEIAEVDDGAIIAAITAAIACIWQQNQEQSGFVVRRVRRVQSGTARARAARDEQIFSRL